MISYHDMWDQVLINLNSRVSSSLIRDIGPSFKIEWSDFCNINYRQNKKQKKNKMAGDAPPNYEELSRPS